MTNLVTGISAYLTQRSSNAPITLGMSMQVKNEADIIALNIKYHAARGVEYFLIIDNGSTDGTWEILQDLQQQFNLQLFRDSEPIHNQAYNMTKLAHIAAKQGIDFLIHNDADEFWFPQSQSLLTFLNRSQTILRVKRVNVLPILKTPDKWLYSPWITNNVVTYDMDTEDYTGVNFLHHRVLHKIMSNSHGLIRVGGGNHGGTHVWDKIHCRKYCDWNQDIKIYHYALRSFEQFKIRVQTISESLTYTTMMKYKKHNFGAHAVHWANAYRQGKLKNIYERMLLDTKYSKGLTDLGIIKKDNSLLKDFKVLGLI